MYRKVPWRYPPATAVEERPRLSLSLPYRLSTWNKEKNNNTTDNVKPTMFFILVKNTHKSSFLVTSQESLPYNILKWTCDEEIKSTMDKRGFLPCADEKSFAMGAAITLTLAAPAGWCWERIEIDRVRLELYSNTRASGPALLHFPARGGCRTGSLNLAGGIAGCNNNNQQEE